MSRILASTLLAVLLVGAAGLARADDDRRVSPLETAERLEREGHELLGAGKKADGAQLLSKAWAIRAEVFRDEARRAAREAELARAAAEPARAKDTVSDAQALEIRRRIAELVAASNEAERRGKEARTAGREEDAARAMEESGRLWREADALKAKFAAVVAAQAATGGEGDLRAKLEALERQLADVRTARDRAREAGKEKDAATLEARVGELEHALVATRERARALEGKGKRDATRPPASPGVDELRAQVAELRQVVDALRKRLDELAK